MQMRSMFNAATVAGAFAAVALGYAPPAAAQSQYVSATCERSERYDDETTCERGVASFSFNAEGAPTRYWMRLTAPSAHCSVVKYHLYRRDASGGFYIIGTTPWLDAGESADLDIEETLPRGEAQFQVGATGKVGGCNQGVMSSWGAYVQPVIVPQ